MPGFAVSLDLRGKRKSLGRVADRHSRGEEWVGQKHGMQAPPFHRLRPLPALDWFGGEARAQLVKTC